MGWGDEIMASGQARRAYEAAQAVKFRPDLKVAIRNQYGWLREHEAWLGNPIIASRNDRLSHTVAVLNAPGYRPYIARKTPTKWQWKEWECPVGELHLSAEEKSFGEAAGEIDVLLEPNLKGKACQNKDWGFERWLRLAELLRQAGAQLTQVGAAGARLIPGVKYVETSGFRRAAAVLSRARVAVLPEGGLHHAAAALGVPAVVLFGGFISPKQTGYSSQENLFTGGEPCGNRDPCRHCAEAMGRIAPEEVSARALRLRSSFRRAA